MQYKIIIKIENFTKNPFLLFIKQAINKTNKPNLMQGIETFKETKIFSEKKDVKIMQAQNNKNNLDKLLLKNWKLFVLIQ